MSGPSDEVQRDVLPIPDRPYEGELPLDAKDPHASFPAIEPLQPPAGAPNVLVILLDDVGFAASSAFGGPCATPTAERLAGNGLKYSRFHTTALCAPTRAALLSGRNHHTVGMGVITELATAAPGYNSIRPNTCAPLAQTLLLNGYSTAQFGKCHEVPVWQTSPMGPVRCLADRRRRLRVLLRLHRRRDEPVLPGHLRGHDAGRARGDAGGGLPLHRRHDRQGDQVDASAEVADARQAVLHVLRTRGDARAASRADGVVGQVQGPFRRGLGRPARGDPDAAEGARGRARGDGADRAPRRDPRLGRHARRAEADPRPPDGGLRRLPRAHRPPHRPARRRARGPRRARGHARLLHHRRQRGERRGRDQRHLQRDLHLQWRRCARDARIHGRAHRRVRHAEGLQPLRGRLGARDGHALPVDEAGRLALGRNPQRHDRPLAARDRRARRGPLAVPPRHRRRPHGARSRRPPPTDDRQRGRPTADRGREHGVLVRRCGRGRPPPRRSTSRCSATAASTTRAGPRSPTTACRG